MIPPELHGGDLARAFVRRSCRGRPERAATLLIVNFRGGRAVYGTLPLWHMPTARMLLDYLEAAPEGTTLSLHKSPALRLVRSG